MAKEATVEFNVKVNRITEKAYLVEFKNYKGKAVEEWMPKSQVVDTDVWAEGDSGLMTVKKWIAEKKEIIKAED